MELGTYYVDERFPLTEDEKQEIRKKYGQNIKFVPGAHYYYHTVDEDRLFQEMADRFEELRKVHIDIAND